jgi:hypothetical protein
VLGDAPRHVGELGRSVADDQRLGMREHFLDGGNHEAGDVRDLVQNVVPVGAVDCRQAHVAVVHAQLVALADEALGELDHRAFSQVVGARLEGETEDAHFALAFLHHRLHAALDLKLIGRQHRAQYWKR